MNAASGTCRCRGSEGIADRLNDGRNVLEFLVGASSPSPPTISVDIPSRFETVGHLGSHICHAKFVAPSPGLRPLVELAILVCSPPAIDLAQLTCEQASPLATEIDMHHSTCYHSY